MCPFNWVSFINLLISHIKISSEEDEAKVSFDICAREFIYEWCPDRTPSTFSLLRLIIEIDLSKEPAAILLLDSKAIEDTEFFEFRTI